MVDNIIDRWTECGVSLGSTCAIGSLDVGILVSLCAVGALGLLYAQRLLRWRRPRLRLRRRLRPAPRVL